MADEHYNRPDDVLQAWADALIPVRSTAMEQDITIKVRMYS